MEQNKYGLSSHELARLLLELPDLPVAVHANNATYSSASDGKSHGELNICLLSHYAGEHIVIGNISKRNINGLNWRVKEMFVGDAPEEWTRLDEKWETR